MFVLLGKELRMRNDWDTQGELIRQALSALARAYVRSESKRCCVVRVRNG